MGRVNPVSRLHVLAVLLALFATVLVGCGSGSGEEEATQTTQESSSGGPRATSPPQASVVDNKEATRAAVAFVAEGKQPATPPDLSGSVDDDLSIEQYFRRLEEIRGQMFEEVEAMGTDVVARFPSASTDAEGIEQLRFSFQEVIAVFGRVIDRLRATDPPEGARAAHRSWVDAELEVRDLLQTWLKILEDSGSMSEFEDRAADLDPLTDKVEERETDACLNLQRLARDNSIDVDLRCDE